jgi:poly(A)-specific ribonuclease
MVQLGICFFERKGGEGGETKYEAYPYNIYLFPEEVQGMQNHVVIDIDTAGFHRQQNFDFNKWIYNGVPYVNERVEKGMLSRLSEERKEEKDELQLQEEDAKKTGQILEGIRKWVSEGAKDQFAITDLNPFLRKFMYQKIEELYPSLYVESRTRGKFEKDILLKSITPEEKQAAKDAKRKEELRELKRKVGARAIFLALVEAKAPIIGHSPIFDLLFMYSHFKDELPRTLTDFKKAILTLFPRYQTLD